MSAYGECRASIGREGAAVAGAAVAGTTHAVAGDVRHAMLLYRSPREHALACSEHVLGGETGGAAGGAAAMAAGTPAHLALLRSVLGEAAGQVEMAELASLAADPGRVLAMLRMFAREHAGKPLRLVQDMGWPERPDEDLAEAIGYEALICRALDGTGAHVLCSYDASMHPAVLVAAERAHEVVLDGGWRPSAGYGTEQEHGRGPDATAPDGGLAALLSPPPAGASSLTFRGDQVAVRRFAADHGHMAGLPPGRVTDLVIAVGELAGNTLRHTDGAGTITIWTTPAELVCQVSDHGHIADPLTGTIRPDPAATGSQRGLWLVHQVGDLVQVRSGPAGTTVRVHLRRSG